MNDAGIPRAEHGRLGAVGVARAHESAMLHVCGEADLHRRHRRSARAPCMRALGLSSKAHARIVAIDLSHGARSAPAWRACLRRRRHPRPERLRPHHPRRSDLRRRPGAVRRPADLHRRRRHPRPGPPRRPHGRRQLRRTAGHPDAAGGARRPAPSCCRRCAWRAATARPRSKRAPHAVKGELYVGGQEQFYLEGQIAYAIPKEDAACWCSARPSTRARCSTWSRTPSAWHSHNIVRSNAAAWAAASAARNRSRRCGARPPPSPRPD